MKNKILSIILVMICASMVYPSFSYASKGHTETVTYKADNPEEKQVFDEKIEVNGKKYKLLSVSYKNISDEYKKVQQEVIHVEQTEPILSGKEHKFAEIMEFDGVTYKLDNVQEVESEPYVQVVTANTDYEYVVTNEIVPQTKVITVNNEITGNEESVECSLSDVRQIGTKWVDSYIDIRFENYDSTAFSWQGELFANDPQAAPLAGYETQLLESVGLTEETGNVIRVYWTSEAYISDGVMYREAKADIEKEVPVYRASYEGKLTTPLVIQEATYKGQTMVESEEIEYTIEAIAKYEVDNTMQYVFSVVMLILIIGIVLLLFIISKKRKNENDSEKNGGNKR